MSRPATAVGSVVGVQAMGMEQWKHMAMAVSPQSHRADRPLTPSPQVQDLDLQAVSGRNVLAVLDSFGEEGWQLVTVIRDADTGPTTYTGTYWLKRRLPESPRKVRTIY